VDTGAHIINASWRIPPGGALRRVKVVKAQNRMVALLDPAMILLDTIGRV
jgi:hypothetical protein